jgi:gamma-glutamyl:cysteine ligase YbdK (ATP-grasp superfamily)
VDVSGGVGAGTLSRVTFGRGYVRESLMQCFQANLDYYPPLLPMVVDEPPEALAHLRLHNGTIWRWNRPLIGFSGSERAPHLRIEHRVASAPNSVFDTIANAAFFFGLVQYLATQDPPPEQLLEFPFARANFYAAARHGLDASVTWLEGSTVALYDLLCEELLPRARDGLRALGLDHGDIDHYLGIMNRRLVKRQNGTGWQRSFVARHGADMRALTEAYIHHQRSGAPIHDWPL